MKSYAAAILRTESLGRCIAGTWLIRGRSLTIGGGDRIVMTGPSGSGKTLWLRALAMLDPLTEGTLRWRGALLSPRTIPPYRADVAYLHQRPWLSEGTVEDNLRLPFAWKVHRGQQFDRGVAIGWLGRLGRDERLLDRPARHLSGGEAQITALARVLQLDPSVLLLDEPTSAVDGATCRTIETYLVQWVDERPERRAWVWISHDPRLGGQISNRRIEVLATGDTIESLP